MFFFSPFPFGGHFQLQHASFLGFATRRCLENKSNTCSPNGGEINDDLPMVGSGKNSHKKKQKKTIKHD